MMKEMKQTEREMLSIEKTLRLQTPQGPMTIHYLEKGNHSPEELDRMLDLRPHLNELRTLHNRSGENHLVLICDSIRYGMDACSFAAELMSDGEEEEVADVAELAGYGIDDLSDFFRDLDIELDEEEDGGAGADEDTENNPLQKIQEDRGYFTIYSEKELDHGACDTLGETSEAQTMAMMRKLVFPVQDTAALIVKCDGLTALSDVTVELLLEQGEKPVIVVVPRGKLNRRQVNRLMFEGAFEVMEIPAPSLDSMVRILREIVKNAGFSLAEGLDVTDVVKTVRKARGSLFGERDLWLLVKNAVRKAKREKDRPQVLDALEMPGYEGNVGSGQKLMDQIVGLEDIKKVLRTELNRQAYRKKLTELQLCEGDSAEPPCKNMAFSGSAGTCKTTMARAMAACMTEQGLSNGVFLEVGREQLVGRYLGETSLKVAQVFQKAQGGVLFIDEAGALVGGDGDSYGREAISAIVRHMENERETTVILATYPEEMEALMEENEGLRSRIGRMISFPDYDEEQLTEIFVSMAKSRGYQLEKNCEEILRRFFRKAMRSQQFGGGREVRRLLERAEGQLANYVMTHTVKRDQLRLLTNCAIEEAAEDLLGEGKEKEVRRPIGFAPSASL